jgi:predicted RNase H-like HicB family nuclease
MLRYGIIIERAEGNLSAYVPDLPGCMTTATPSMKSART